MLFIAFPRLLDVIKGVYREEGMQLTLFSESPNLDTSW